MQIVLLNKPHYNQKEEKNGDDCLSAPFLSQLQFFGLPTGIH